MSAEAAVSREVDDSLSDLLADDVSAVDVSLEALQRHVLVRKVAVYHCKRKKTHLKSRTIFLNTRNIANFVCTKILNLENFQSDCTNANII